uniref:Uncharacterized protein n=1 Tax=Callorhinchus milii TaxID=7868 RepID=A0A4W3HNG7_CALMI
MASASVVGCESICSTMTGLELYTARICPGNSGIGRPLLVGLETPETPKSRKTGIILEHDAVLVQRRQRAPQHSVQHQVCVNTKCYTNTLLHILKTTTKIITESTNPHHCLEMISA